MIASPFSDALDITLTSRRPPKLPEATVRAALEVPIAVERVRQDPSFKRVSVVVVTFNNLAYTRLCLASVLTNTEYPNYEVIVVDNGSTDETPSFLQDLAGQYSHVRIRLNDRNLGFAPAVNRGLAMADGEVLVLLNNDTIVPPEWLTGLLGYLDDPCIGAVGPVTNRIGNEAQIDAPYRTYGEFLQFVHNYTSAHRGRWFDIGMLAMFCLAVRRDVLERIGPLDERFEVGMLEDDDYALRLHRAAYRTVCAEDVFVHHFGQASFGSLVPTGEYWKLLEANRRRFEEKWDTPWVPYARRISNTYRALQLQIREVVRSVLPAGTRVLVVSKGDEALLDLDGRLAEHFPQDERGGYAGYYPADSNAAIAHLEMLRVRGAEYLLIPRPAFWWLEHYAEFRTHLSERYRNVARPDECCVIFDLDAVELDRSHGITPAGCRPFAPRQPGTSDLGEE